MTPDEAAEGLTVRGLLEAGADDDPAIVTPSATVLTHAQLRAEVDRLADRLRELSAGRGSRTAIVMPNGAEMAVAFLAAACAGCVAPLNPKYRAAELSFYLSDLGAGTLITAPGETGAAARSAAAETGALSVTLSGELAVGAETLQLDVVSDASRRPPANVAARDDAGPNGRPTGAAAGRRSGAEDRADPLWRLDIGTEGECGERCGVPDPEDVALVLHTSGTTSRPKIVPLRQRHLARSAAQIAESLALSSADRSLNVMPLFHIHGLLAGLLAPLSAGGSVACTEGFDAFRFFGQLSALAPTYYTAVPTMHQMLIARSPRHRDAARGAGLRFVRSSSASLPEPVMRELADLFDAPVIEAYGMTEATHQMCSNPLPPAAAKPRSVGRPTGIELAVLDSHDLPVPLGERGEVSIKAPTVIDGYENNPEANAAAFTSGWFRTGDEGYLDADGYLFLTGRLKEQINRGGEKVSPLEVDEALLRHPAVAEAVTFAVPHPVLGEEVAAAVVLGEAAEVSERELRDFVSRSLAAFKVPRRILVLDELPKGPTGKLQRIGLADRLDLAD